MNVHLIRPEWLWALLPAVLFALALWRGNRGSGQWQDVVDPALLQHLLVGEAGGRRRNLTPWFLALWCIAILALAGPSLRKIPQPLHEKRDALVVLLDLSYSMTAGDLAPTRIDRARQKLRDLLAERREGQTALVAYAGDAHVVTPLTDDTPTIANLLPALEPSIMPRPGSQPAQAARLALELLHSAGARGGRLLLLTDGIDDADRKALVDLLRGSGVSLSILGIGTAQGAPLPLPEGGFLKDQRGAIVMPGLDEDQLRRTAKQAAGRYQRMQLDDSDLRYLLADDALPGTGDTQALARTADAWEDQGYLLVLCLLPAVLALFRRGWIACLLPLLLLPAPQAARADGWDDLWLTRDQQGQQALQAQDYEHAAKLFEDPARAGAAAYQGGDYAAAEQDFARGDSADDWYNRGNALARQGKLEEALDAYAESLARDPEQADAQANQQLVEDLLEQQQEQEQQQQQDNGGEQDQDQQQQGESGDQQQGDSSGQDSGNQEQGEQSSSDNGQPDPRDQDGSRQDPAQSPGQDKQTQDGQDPADEAGQAQQPEGEDPAQEQARAQQAEESDKEGDGEQGAMNASAETGAEGSERDQALEQWLRRVPDDPAGLLREKFRYESRQRQQQGNSENDDSNW